MAKTINGVPPLKQHVIIYFSEKNIHETEALSFYYHYQNLRWKNGRNRPIVNWKVKAWEWILNLRV